MKEIKEEIKREVVDTHIYYEATDGTRFNDAEECRKYEASALGMLRSKIAKMAVSDKKDAWELMGGYDGHKVVAFAFNSEKDVDTFIQWMYLEWHYFSEEYMKAKERIVRKVYVQKDVLLLGVNYKDEYYFINSRNNIIANLKALGKE